jgi:hypothetical protein
VVIGPRCSRDAAIMAALLRDEARDAPDLGAAQPARPARPARARGPQPVAALLGTSGRGRPRRFLGGPARLVGVPDAVPVIGDTALPKEGTLSIGAARRRCAAGF